MWGKWFSTAGNYVPPAQETSGVIFWLSPLRAEVLLASSGQRPGMLLNTLSVQHSPPTTKNYWTPNVNIAEVENSLILKILLALEF